MALITTEECEAATLHEVGFCTTCQDFTTGNVKPSARDVMCVDCFKFTVMGATVAMQNGLIALVPIGEIKYTNKKEQSLTPESNLPKLTGSKVAPLPHYTLLPGDSTTIRNLLGNGCQFVATGVVCVDDSVVHEIMNGKLPSHLKLIPETHPPAGGPWPEWLVHPPKNWLMRLYDRWMYPWRKELRASWQTHAEIDAQIEYMRWVREHRAAVVQQEFRAARD